MGVMVGYVLAGGRSKRMGTHKGMLPYGDHPTMIDSIADTLRVHCVRVHAVIKPGQIEQCPEQISPLVERPGLPEHPLSGIVAGLDALGPKDWGVFVPCDSPGMSRCDIQRLLDVAQQGRGSVASDGVKTHPLICCIPSTAIQWALECVENERSARHFVATLTPVVFSGSALQNYNTPEQWEGQV